MTRFIALALSIVMSLSMTSASAKPEPKNTEISTVAAVGNYTTRFARIGAPILPYGPLIVNYLDDIIDKYVERVNMDDAGDETEDSDEENVVKPVRPFYMTRGHWVFTKDGPRYVPFLIHPPMYRPWLERFNDNLIGGESNGNTPTIPSTGEDEDEDNSDSVVASDKEIENEKVPEETKPAETKPSETNPPADTKPKEETTPTTPKKEEQSKPTEPKPTEPPATEPPVTEPPATEPPTETPTEPEAPETQIPTIELPQTGPVKECTTHDMVFDNSVVNAEYAFTKSVTDYYVCSVCGYECNETRDVKRDVSDAELASYANEIVRYVNAARAEAGLSELWTSSEFTSYAKTRANEQIERYGHIRPNGASYAFASGNYYTLGENTSAGYSSARGFYNAFMNSASHRGYIMYEEAVGIAVGISVGDDGTPYCVMHIICSY